MITGAIKNQVDQIWNALWSGGISKSLEVIEQITYLLFRRRLHDLHTLEENKSARLREPMARRVFPEGSDGVRIPASPPFLPQCPTGRDSVSRLPAAPANSQPPA